MLLFIGRGEHSTIQSTLITERGEPPRLLFIGRGDYSPLNLLSSPGDASHQGTSLAARAPIRAQSHRPSRRIARPVSSQSRMPLHAAPTISPFASAASARCRTLGERPLALTNHRRWHDTPISSLRPNSCSDPRPSRRIARPRRRSRRSRARRHRPRWRARPPRARRRLVAARRASILRAARRPPPVALHLDLSSISSPVRARAQDRPTDRAASPPISSKPCSLPQTALASLPSANAASASCRTAREHPSRPQATSSGTSFRYCRPGPSTLLASLSARSYCQSRRRRPRRRRAIPRSRRRPAPRAARRSELPSRPTSPREPSVRPQPHRSACPPLYCWRHRPRSRTASAAVVGPAVDAPSLEPDAGPLLVRRVDPSCPHAPHHPASPQSVLNLTAPHVHRYTAGVAVLAVVLPAPPSSALPSTRHPPSPTPARSSCGASIRAPLTPHITTRTISPSSTSPLRMSTATASSRRDCAVPSPPPRPAASSKSELRSAASRSALVPFALLS